MNIMINTSLFNYLRQYIITTINFGSRGKGSDTGDYDFLHIIPDFQLSLLLPFNNKHLLQYSEYVGEIKHNDHVFMTLSQLIHSITNGDNMFIIEIILSNLKNTHYLSKIPNNNFLKELFSDLTLEDFITFNILRGLLGLAERDLKDIQYKKDFNLNESKKFRFVKESLFFFFKLYNSTSTNPINDRILDLNESAKHIIFTEYVDYIEFRTEYNNIIEQLRKYINYLTKEYKTIQKEKLYNLITKINKYSVINDIKVDYELYNVYYSGA